MKERPLVIFTLLTQMTVGAFTILLAIFWQFSYFFGVNSGSRLILPYFIFIGALFMVGLAASLFHLGSPLNAWRALANLRNSWLSREVLFSLLFAALAGFFVFFQWLEISSSSFRNLVALLATCFGITLIYCMARVYMLRTVSQWNSGLTVASFFTTAFILGCLVDGVMLSFSAVFMPLEESVAIMQLLHWIGGLCVLLLLVEFLLIPLGLARLIDQNMGDSSGRPISQIYLMRVVPLFLGIATVGVLFFLATPLNFFEAIVVLMAFGFVLFSETFGRMIFYDSRQPLM